MILAQSKEFKNSIKAEFQLADKIKLSNIDSVYLIASRIHERSMSESYQKGLAMANTLVGFCYYKSNEFDSARIILTEVFDFYDRNVSEKNSIEYASALMYSSYVHVGYREFEIAVQSEIERKIQDLNQQSIKMIQKNNRLLDVREGLKNVKKGLVNGKAQEVQSLLNTIRVDKIVDKEWKKFDEYFGTINQAFLGRLSFNFPSLTITERRLSSLIKMGFTNREISEIINIEDKSVRMAKYGLKKKLGLDEGAKIEEFLGKIESKA